MVSTSSQRTGRVSVEVPAVSNVSHPSSLQRAAITTTSTSNNTHKSASQTLEDEVTAGRIPYASKGKWKEKTRQDIVDSDEEYLSSPKFDIKAISARAEHSSKQVHTYITSQIRAGPRGGERDKKHKAPTPGQFPTSLNASTLREPGRRTGSSLANSHAAIRHVTPPAPHADSYAAQTIFDRPPPVPPPLPQTSALPWFLIYAPEVTLARLDVKEIVDSKQDLDYLSEGSQGRTSASRATPTSVSGLSRTPSKTRMRMVPAGQRDRSRSRKLTVEPEEDDSDNSRSGRKERSASIQDGDSDGSTVIVSASSSETDSDHEETDGTDSEVEELIEFKKATRRLAEVRYPDARASSSTHLTIPCKKRKLLLEETLPSTFGSRHALSVSRIAVDGLKPGMGPRAIARKSFARAIGSRLLARKRKEGR